MLSLPTSFPRTWLFSFKKEKRKRNRALTTVLIQLLHHFTFFILQKCITNTNTYKHNESLLCPIFLISQWPTVSPWRLLKPEGQSADCSGPNACLPACLLCTGRIPPSHPSEATRVLTELNFLNGTVHAPHVPGYNVLITVFHQSYRVAT